ncbi:MAG: NYN domain-containing protein, partial [Candidatus Hodarchaeota archaeon]
MPDFCRCPNCMNVHHVYLVPDSTKSRLSNRIALFIDGGNLYHAAKKLGFKVDLLRLREFFLSSNADLYRAYYYAAFDSTQGFIMKILDYLRHNGFIVVTKRVKKFSTMIKGNLDVELVIDMMITLEYYDTAILVSGDGDFKRCVEELQKRNKKIIVVSTEKTSPPLLAQELKNQADEFIELAEIIPFVEE